MKLKDERSLETRADFAERGKNQKRIEMKIWMLGGRRR